MLHYCVAIVYYRTKSHLNIKVTPTTRKGDVGRVWFVSPCLYNLTWRRVHAFIGTLKPIVRITFTKWRRVCFIDIVVRVKATVSCRKIPFVEPSFVHDVNCCRRALLVNKYYPLCFIIYWIYFPFPAFFDKRTYFLSGVLSVKWPMESRLYNTCFMTSW